MTPQEQSLLEDFLNRLSHTQSGPKDAQADALIQERLAGRPDALYLLVQRAILLEQGLAVAKQQLAQSQRQNAQAATGSFLGADAASAPPEPRRPSWRERFLGSGARPAASAQPSFLASAATTAAGVAGGMFLAQGLEELLGGHHGGGFAGGDANVVENITADNVIYEDGPEAEKGGFDSSGAFADDYDSGADFDDSGWT